MSLLLGSLLGCGFGVVEEVRGGEGRGVIELEWGDGSGEMMRNAVSRAGKPSSDGSVVDSERSAGISSIEHTKIRPSTFAIRDGEFFQSLPLKDVEVAVTSRRTSPSRVCRGASRRVVRCFQKRSGVKPCSIKRTMYPGSTWRK